ncbi:response regulator receiver protein [Archaeoglobus profundus DSM 5631]|uniref:Response regulator receiver protein n=2 Tax=Archaeoglobus profundus TaxID=84156 RepID=D2RD63_ARCPA|nr:response regulator receiver protein [Archaeoglobus profundus DSM 5631]
MIVDDDLAVLEVLQLMLEGDYDIITARDGKEAVEKFKVYRPDLVIMDIVMPEMDGIQATKEILKIDPNAKIVAISAYARHKGKDMLDAGALELLDKPFTKAKLMKIVKKYISD